MVQVRIYCLMQNLSEQMESTLCTTTHHISKVTIVLTALNTLNSLKWSDMA